MSFRFDEFREIVRSKDTLRHALYIELLAKTLSTDTIFLLICKHGNDESVNLFLDRFPKPNKQTMNDGLREAVYQRNTCTSESLLKQGSDPNYAKKFQAPLIVFAAEFEMVDMIRVLIRYGVNVNARDANNGRTARHWAETYKNAYLIDILTDAGALSTKENLEKLRQSFIQQHRH